MDKFNLTSITNTKKSNALKLYPNKIYVIFLAATAIALILILVSSIIFSVTKKGQSVNYNQTLTLTEYYIKVDNASYNTVTSDFCFYWYVKSTRSEPSATAPSIYSVFADYSDSDDFFDYDIDKMPDNDYAYQVTVHNVKPKFSEINIVFTSKTADVQPAPEADEFGNVITYDVIEGENIYIKTVISIKDVQFVKTDEKIKPPKEDLDVPLETNKPVSSFAITSPSATTTTVVTSPSATTTTAVTASKTEVPTTVTTTEKTETPKITTTSSNTASTTKAVTTKKSDIMSPTKTTAKTTTKAVTTTKKTTTTTKKVTTAKPVTTTKKTTTLTPIPLRGLALKTSSADNTVYLKVGETTTITPVFTPEQATNQKVTWSSNREDRAVVSQSGVVTARSPGAVIIKCVADDGGLSAACMIIVEE